MKKLVVFVLLVVMCLSVISVASADKLESWATSFTYEVPTGTFVDGDSVFYSFEFSWTYPYPNGWSGGMNEFSVSDEAPLYPGYVVFRGPFGVYAKLMGSGGRECVQFEEPVTIHPDQPVRFHIGWRTDELLPAQEARKHFESMTAVVDWGDGAREMTRNEIAPYNEKPWQSKICSFTVRN